MTAVRKAITRRTALQAGAGVLGALATLKSGVSPAPAQAFGNPVRLDPSSPDQPVVPEGSKDKDWAKRIEDALGGTKGMFEDHGVFKIDLPRTDIKNAKISDVHVEPDFALNGELTFKKVGNNTVMKFEVVLLDKEVNPVLFAWLDQNLQPELEQFTALHNHYLADSPQIRFLHGFAVGNETRIAGALYTALKKNSGTPFGHGEEPPGNPGFDWKRVTKILGGKGTLTNGVLMVDVPRKESFRERGVTLPTEMDFESMFNFQSIGNGKVASISEFVLLKDEVDRVARELRHRNMLVTALHNHELDVDPDVYYIHSWATGDPIKVARDLRAALNRTNSDFQSAE